MLLRSNRIVRKQHGHEPFIHAGDRGWGRSYALDDRYLMPYDFPFLFTGLLMELRTEYGTRTALQAWATGPQAFLEYSSEVCNL